MRARLNDRLGRAARFPITLIAAPAGFGKSVALRDFIASSRLDAVRYDVRREDDTLLAFVRGLSEALEPIAPSARAAFASVQQTVMATQAPVRELADWLAEHLKRCVCRIVIDDLHYAAADPASVVLLSELIDRTAGRIGWIIATRSDAGLPVASWIGYGRMDLPIGEDDLRFTPEEALVVAERARTGIASEEVEQLRELTDGWPVALAIALRTRTYAADIPTATSGTREMIYRYLAEQVLARISPSQRRFLLDTCVFNSFDGATATELGATPEFLAAMRREVTFLSIGQENEYRYHDLFRDFLERELERSGAAEWKRALVRAGTLLEKRGDFGAALSLYAKARDAGAILAGLRASGFALFERGQAPVLDTALDALPEQDRHHDATALGLQATLRASRGHFDLAEPDFAAAIDRATDRSLQIELVHRYAIQLVRHGRDCSELLAPYESDENISPQLRVPILGTLATSFVRTGRVDEALARVQRALEMLQSVADDTVRARIHQQAAHVFEQAAMRERAQSHATLAVELALANNLYEVAARAYSVLYAIAYEQGDPIATLTILDALGECARKGGSRQVLLFGLIAGYEIEVERANDVALEDLDRQLDESSALLPQAYAKALLPARAMRASWSGAFERAHELLAGTADQQPTSERRALRAAEVALYAFAAGHSAEGERALSHARAEIERSSPVSRRVARTHLVVALAELVRGHVDAAHRRLAVVERSLDAQSPRLRAFAQAVRALHRRTLGQAEAAETAAALERLRAANFGGFARLVEKLPIAYSATQGYGILTSSEKEILALLAKGASTKDVAARTGRSPQTVDTHIRSICRKLRCSGRREAVALAVSSGWVVS